MKTKVLIALLVILNACALTAMSQTRRGSTVNRRSTRSRTSRAVRKVPPAPPCPATAATTTPSGLTYFVTRPGTGAALKAGDRVTVHYTGLLTDGTKFDSSRDRTAPFTFPLGARRVIAGWDEGIARLRIGDHATLVIPSQLGYGARGAGDTIPPGATLIFIVEVVGVEGMMPPPTPAGAPPDGR